MFLPLRYPCSYHPAMYVLLYGGVRVAVRNGGCKKRRIRWGRGHGMKPCVQPFVDDLVMLASQVHCTWVDHQYGLTINGFTINMV